MKTMEQKLVFAFRNVDNPDWEWLQGKLDRTGESEFWRCVIREIRAALASGQTAGDEK